jgi:hypothetical protein
LFGGATVIETKNDFQRRVHHLMLPKSNTLEVSDLTAFTILWNFHRRVPLLALPAAAEPLKNRS